MSYKKVDVKKEPLTPELAKTIAEMPGVPGERKLKTGRLAFLHTHVEKGSFVGPNWAVATDRSAGQQYRINGQHSSHMLAALDEALFPADLIVTVDYYECDSIREDGPALFDLFDNPKATRSDTEHMGTLRVQFPDLVAAGVDNGFLARVTDGIDLNQKEKRESLLRTNPDSQQADLIMLWPHRDHGLYFWDDTFRAFAIWLWQWKDSKHWGYVSRSGVVSEMLDDYKYNIQIATEFWGFVLYENHPDKDDESHALSTAIDSMREKPKAKPADYHRVAKKHFTRFRKLREAQIKSAMKPNEDAREETGETESLGFALPPAESTGLQASL
jgi:hypothetical protein